MLSSRRGGENVKEEHRQTVEVPVFNGTVDTVVEKHRQTGEVPVFDDTVDTVGEELRQTVKACI